MTITAVILAGGLGTRLRAVVPNLPKPMAPIDGRPFLEYLLDYWLLQGIERFVLSVGYKHDLIVEHFGHDYKGASVDYAIEPTPMGTGGGLMLAAKKLSPDSSFLVLNGDTYFAVDLQALRQFAQRNEADWCFSLFSTSCAGRYMGMDVLSDGRINALTPGKEREASLANGGVYWVRYRALMETKLPPSDTLSLEKDIFPAALSAKQRLFGLAFDEAFIDIGIPDDYHRSNSIINIKERA